MLMGSSMGCSSQSRDVSARESSISKSAEQKATPDTLTFAFVGDIMMGTTFPSRMLPADDGKHLFRDAKDILQRADIAAGNLEGTLCDGGQTKKKVSNICYAFRTPTSYAHHVIAGCLTDCFRKTGNGVGYSYSHYGMYVRIDHVFCSDDWTPVSCKIDKNFTVSDHLPAICCLKKRPKP